MKKYSVNFNKQSRLHKRPEINHKSDKTSELYPLNPDKLTERLKNTLQIQNDFFPCFDWTFPPPLLSQSAPPTQVDELFSKPSVIPNTYSLYLHSPFCKTLCSFCYYSVLPGKGINESATYIDYLVREMALYAERMSGSICESIYFGGGTPTFLDDKLLIKVFSAIYDNFNIKKNAEITIEAAPGTLPFSKIKLLKSLGVNRLSYGIQTLDEKLLATCNRDYSVKESIVELENALHVIGNINVDTMYGFDGEPDGALEKSLDKFYKMGVPNLSIYSLDNQRSDQKLKFEPPKDLKYEQKIIQFSKAKEYLLDRGYEHVLQNVFVNPEKGSYLHQLRRWDNLSLVALGISAQGYAPKTTFQNLSNLKGYYHHLDQGIPPIATVDYLSPEMEMCRELTTKLRFTHIDTDEFKLKYGVQITDVFGDLIHSLVELEYLEHNGNMIRMTSKSAYYNNIIPMLFSPDTFKEAMLSLPEEYLEEFPVPYVTTQVGSVQSTAMNIDTGLAASFRHNRRQLAERRKKTITSYTKCQRELNRRYRGSSLSTK